MFMKRFYNSIRFYTSLITQLLLPIVFVILALALGKTLPNVSEDDMKRSLAFDNNVLSGNSTVFWTDFADLYSEAGYPFDFSVSF